MKRKFPGIVLFFLFSLFSTGGWVNCYSASTLSYAFIYPVPSLSFSEEPQIKPAYLRKAEREAAKKERQKKRDFNKAIKENINRALDIQTPEVRERMKLNRKEANKTAREKRRVNKSRTKKAARKFR